jgi:hypothetical protein
MLVAAAAWGSSTAPSPTVTPVPSLAPEPAAATTAVPAAAAVEDASGAARREYVAAIRAIREVSDARSKEIFDPVNNAAPGPAGFMSALTAALPLAIEGGLAEIAALEALAVPEAYLTDQQRVLSFLREQISLARRQLDAAEARDELSFGAMAVESNTLSRNFAKDLSPSFREFFFVAEQGRDEAERFGDLTPGEAAYLDTVSAGFEEFRKRNAVFGQTLSRQFSDARAMLEALRGAGAGSAFEAVQDVIAPVQPPERFLTDHELLIQYLDNAVRLDREIGKAIEEGDPVAFMVSNFGLMTVETSVRAALELSPQVLDIAQPQNAFSLNTPGPAASDGGYRDAVYRLLRELRVRFPRVGPDYLLFNLIPEDAYQVISQVAPGFISTLEDAQERFAELTPPDDLRADHDRLARYFEATVAAQRAVVDAAAAEEVTGVRDGIARTRSAFCDTARGLSDAMKPVVFVHFGGPPPDPDLMRECGPVR